MCTAYDISWASQVALVVKNLPANAGYDVNRCGFNPWVRKIPWRRKWQPIPVFLPGKSHEQRSLMRYNPYSHQESEMTERSIAAATSWLDHIPDRLLMKVKEKSEKIGLKLNIQKTKIMASGSITSRQIEGETMTVFIFRGSKITADGDCSHEIQRRLLLERKIMTNLDSILKSRDITLPTKV